MLNKSWLWVFAIIVLSACTTATSSSRQTVNFTDTNKPKSMVVGVLIGNLEWRSEAETSLQKRIGDRGVKTQRLMDVVARGQEINTSDQMIMATKGSGADYLLVVWFTPAGRQSGSDSDRAPPQYASIEEARTTYRYNTYYVPSGPSTVYIASFSAMLLDLKSGEKVWEATVNTRSSAAAGAQSILNTAVSEAYSRLVNDKVI